MEKLKLVIYLLFAITPLLGNSSYAEWTKYSGNPVLNLGAPGTWDSVLVHIPTVIYDGTKYKMWYVGYGSKYRIGYAESSDGMVWNKYPNPVLDVGASGTWDAVAVHSPTVIYDGGIYKMWYEGFSSFDRRRIGYATSPDGITWTKYSGNPVLDMGAPGTWDSGYFHGPTVIKEDSIYKMWYGAYNGATHRIGYAVSTDGIAWTKYSGNPVLNVGVPGAFDDSHVSQPSVIKEGDTYRMWYQGGSSRNPPLSIGYAESSDGITWTKGNGPDLSVGSSGAWDSFLVADPTVILDGDTYKMWYVGIGNDRFTHRIGYATKPSPCSIKADAGADQIVEQTSLTGANVTLNGFASTGSNITYSWSWSGGTANGANPTVFLPAGTTTITLTVSKDSCSSTDTVTIAIQDIMPPATSATTSGTSGGNGWYTSDVNVNLSAVDSGSGVKEIHCTIDNGAEMVIGGDNISISLSMEGSHTVKYFAKDNAGNIEAVQIMQVNIDKTAPSISCSSNPNLLWPPNHKLISVKTLVTVTDDLSGANGFYLTSAYSSEPDNGQGDGDTANDIQGALIGTQDIDLLLRAERSGNGNTERVYTLIYSSSDIAGNNATCTVNINVPSSQ